MRVVFFTHYGQGVIANQPHVAFDLMYHFDGKCGERAAASILNLLESHRAACAKAEVTASK